MVEIRVLKIAAMAASAIMVSITAGARDWYVAPGGVDGGAGTMGDPLATVAHAVSRATAGDSILLERNGTYYASDLNTGSGLSITAYGTGALPIVTGSVRVNLPGTWGPNPSVRTGAVSQRVVACYVDGRFVRLARWPNIDDGFLRVDNDDNPHRIVDAELATRPGVAAGRWSGANVRWRRWSWWWETRPISQHSPVNTLDLDPAGSFHDPFSDPGSGYFIDNDLDELDAPGEWHWQAGVLYLYPPSWADPATMKVDVVTTTSADPVVDHENEPVGVGTSGTSFESIHFSRYYGTALSMGHPASVDSCTFSELESTAVRFTWDSQPFTITRSIFRDVRNIAIKGWADLADPPGSLIERNLFLRIGAEPGYGGWGSWHAAGIILGQANAAVVRLNRFVDTGYAGIILGSDGQTVENNIFVRSMGTLNDGAAVYTNCNASIIRGNIILDTIGNLEYSHPWWPMGHGIWPEFLSDFHDTVITDNTIYGSNGHGIFLPNNFDCTISGNVIVDSRRAALGLYVDANPNQNHSHHRQHPGLHRTDPPHRPAGEPLPMVAPALPRARSGGARVRHRRRLRHHDQYHFRRPDQRRRGDQEEARRHSLHDPRRMDRRCELGVGGGQSHQTEQRHPALQRHRGTGDHGSADRQLDPSRWLDGRGHPLSPALLERGAGRRGRGAALSTVLRGIPDRLASRHPRRDLPRQRQLDLCRWLRVGPRLGMDRRRDSVIEILAAGRLEFGRIEATVR